MKTPLHHFKTRTNYLNQFIFCKFPWLLTAGGGESFMGTLSSDRSSSALLQIRELEDINPIQLITRIQSCTGIHTCEPFFINLPWPILCQLTCEDRGSTPVCSSLGPHLSSQPPWCHNRYREGGGDRRGQNHPLDGNLSWKTSSYIILVFSFNRSN